jgi:hypothetical protein
MKTKIIVLCIVFLGTNKLVLSQSLESQLKLVFGDALSTYEKNDPSRILGKPLSTSSNMKYNMELIQAQNSYYLTLYILANTHLDENNLLVPNPGFQWINPNDPSDFRLASSGSSVTLPPYDLTYLNRAFNRSKFGPLFTYNWCADINANNLTDFSDFSGIKRTFNLKEPICFAFTIICKEGSYRSGREYAAKKKVTIQIFNNANGNIIGKEETEFYHPEGRPRLQGRVYYECLGNFLPVGKYLISVSGFESLKEYFEVIE